MQHPLYEALRSLFFLPSLPGLVVQQACFYFVDAELYSSLYFLSDFVCQKVIITFLKTD